MKNYLLYSCIQHNWHKLKNLTGIELAKEVGNLYDTEGVNILKKRQLTAVLKLWN